MISGDRLKNLCKMLDYTDRELIKYYYKKL